MKNEMKGDAEETEEKPTSLIPFIWTAVAISATVVIFGLFVGWRVGWNWEQSGTFGDTFGVLNALFSGLAFAGLIYTILLQRHELNLQRKELALTRQVLKDQTAEFESQNELLEEQRIEDTFFRLLQMFRGNFTSVVFFHSHKPMVGREAFEYLIYDAAGHIQGGHPNIIQSAPLSGISHERDGTLAKAVAISMQFSLGKLEAYISTLNILIQFVNTSATPKLYKEIISSQLTIEEQVILIMYAKNDRRIEQICLQLHLQLPHRVYLPKTTYHHSGANKHIEEIMKQENFTLNF